MLDYQRLLREKNQIYSIKLYEINNTFAIKEYFSTVTKKFQ